jgi:hypothetical protein
MLASVARAHLDRLAAQVGPVQPKEIEGVQERLAFVPTMAKRAAEEWPAKMRATSAQRVNCDVVGSRLFARPLHKAVRYQHRGGPNFDVATQALKFARTSNHLPLKTIGLPSVAAPFVMNSSNT